MEDAQSRSTALPPPLEEETSAASRGEARASAMERSSADASGTGQGDASAAIRSKSEQENELESASGDGSRGAGLSEGESSASRKHLWHGLLFIVTGTLMLGSYVILGEGRLFEGRGLGPLVGVGLIGFGFFLLVRGRPLLERNTPFVEYYDAIVLAVGVALFVRTFIIEPFKIPSGSMIPTLLVGDYLFVNKMAYGHRVPFMRYRAFMGEGPQRGDIAVFEYPRDPGKDYIKRIIGLPGDQIVYDRKRLTINGIPALYQPQGVFTFRNERGREITAESFVERFEDIPPHSILVQPASYHVQRYSVDVPEGHYFVMGDNRDNSNDSRFWGFVPAHRLVGKAVGLFFSWDEEEWAPRWERLGQGLE